MILWFSFSLSLLIENRNKTKIKKRRRGKESEGKKTYEAEQQVAIVPGQRYPALPTPTVPQVPSIETVTPDRGAWHAPDELEKRVWHPPVVRQNSSPVPQKPYDEQHAASEGHVHPWVLPPGPELPHVLLGETARSASRFGIVMASETEARGGTTAAERARPGRRRAMSVVFIFTGFAVAIFFRFFLLPFLFLRSCWCDLSLGTRSGAVMNHEVAQEGNGPNKKFYVPGTRIMLWRWERNKNKRRVRRV